MGKFRKIKNVQNCPYIKKNMFDIAREQPSEKKSLFFFSQTFYKIHEFIHFIVKRSECDEMCKIQFYRVENEIKIELKSFFKKKSIKRTYTEY